MKLTKADILGHAVDGIYAKLGRVEEVHGIKSKEYKEMSEQYSEIYKQYQREYVRELAN